MADKARELTDKRLAAISKRLSREYNSARKELTDKLTKYLARADKRLEGLVAGLSQAQAKGDAAAIYAARQKLEKAKLNITLNDKRYREMIADLTDRLADVNQTALSYVNGQMPYIYRQNYNGAKEPAAEVGMSFSLMNEEAVARRVQEGDIKLPKKKIDIPKDKRWNTKQLNSSVLQGILQGESMQKIAKRILPIVDNNRDAAIRNARTMVTGAENEGRLDGYHKLEEEGAILKKVWIATADSRTREAHLFLDGQEVGIDEPFVDADGNELMYPGDPSAEPGTVYNCRCSMRTHIVGFRKSDGRVEPVKFDHKSGMHQDAIEREREKRGVETPQEPEKAEKPYYDRIKEIAADLRANGFDEAKVQEAGGILADELDKVYTEKAAKLEAAKKAYDDAGQSELDAIDADKKYRWAESIHYGWKDPASSNGMFATKEEAEEYYQRLMKRQKEIWESKEYNDARQAYFEEKKDNRKVDWKIDAMKDKLSAVREVGTDSIGTKAVKEHLNVSRSPSKKFIEQAYQAYPTEWVRDSLNYGKLQIVTVQRGYCADNLIAISGGTDGQKLATAFHEIGHRYERCVPGIRDAEKEFYERRTKGEDLKWLGAGYGKDEKTRRDQFVSPYMGKDYGGRAYELVSMGFEYAYTNPAALAKDKDMQRWILGLLCTQ